MIKIARLFFLCGFPGTGKTVSAGTGKRPQRFYDYDGGFDSIRYAKNKDGSLIVPDWKDIEVVDMTRKAPTKVSLMAKKDSGIPPPNAKAYKELVEQFNKEIEGLSKGDKHYGSMVVDSFTAVVKSWKMGLLFANSLAALRLGDYDFLWQIAVDHFLNGLEALTTVDNVIITDHVDFIQSEESGAIKEFPSATSRPKGREIAKYIGEVYYQHVEGGKYVWRTRQYKSFEGAKSRLGLPDPMPADFKELEKILKDES